MVDDAAPLTELWWTYQAGDANIRYLHHMITCLVKDTLKSSHIYVNYEKIRKMTQDKKSCPFYFTAY